MAYIRKTQDEFQVQQYYPWSGWEAVMYETSRAAAREQAKCYRVNQPEYAVRIVKVRIPVGVAPCTSK